MSARTTGIACGFMLNFSKPRPTRTGTIRGSAAISPHIETSTPRETARLISPGYQAEHGRISRFIEVRNKRIGAIDRQRVLDEIVGSDGHEIDFLRQFGGHYGG